ncbi:MAG: hypothetical protein AAFY60_13705 [Myxococcota bacterium]
MAWFLVLSCWGCDLGPYPDLDEPVDRFDGLGSDATTSYLLADDAGAIALVLSGAGSGEYTWTEFASDSGGATIEAGSYVEEVGQLMLNATLLFTGETFQNPFGERPGSFRNDLEQTRSFALTRDEQMLTLDDGRVFEFERLDSVMERVGQVSTASILALYRMAEVSSHARIVGFGTAAMLEYTTPTRFNSTVSGDFEVELRGLLEPTTTIDYRRTQEFTGLVIHGPQRTTTNSSGDGFSHGTVDMELFRPGEDAPFFEASIFYGESDGSTGVVVSDGTPSGGEYVLIRGSRRDTVESSVYLRGDLRGWFRL